MKQNKENNWYEQWMQQSQAFLTSAEKNLRDVFGNNTSDPLKYMTQIQQWMESMKQQWEFAQLTDEQKAQQVYWKMMTGIYQEAMEMMFKQWVKRTEEKDPVKSIRELYEIWLDCCHEVYQKSLKSQAYQTAFADMMNASFKLWQQALQK